ncbi:MAG: hypothetical protein ABEK36_00035 [Candidatus Aenigmatarchaeota archaeon]
MSNKYNIKILGTDYNETLDPSRMEIGLGYIAFQNNWNSGNYPRALKLLTLEQGKMVCQMGRDGCDNKLLESFSHTLEGENFEELYEKIHYADENGDVVNFEENLNGFPRYLYEKFVPSKIKNKTGGEFYKGSMETFDKATRKDVRTMVYTHAIENLVNKKLGETKNKDKFTEGVLGNKFKTNENGEIIGVDWEVDDPQTPKDERKSDFLDLWKKEGINPNEIAYIENELNGVLYKLKEEGGLPIIAPSADYDVKEEANKEDIFVPDSKNIEDGWKDIRKYIGLENSKQYALGNINKSTKGM